MYTALHVATVQTGLVSYSLLASLRAALPPTSACRLTIAVDTLTSAVTLTATYTETKTIQNL